MDHKGWYTRGYLPHCDFSDSIQGITFRLADSVPKEVIDSWREQLKDNGIHGRPAETELYRKISKYEDAGYGDCILRRAECSDVVQAQLKKHGRLNAVYWTADFSPPEIRIPCGLKSAVQYTARSSRTTG